MPRKFTLTWRQLRGMHCEGAARQFLEAKGLQLLARNYRCKLGEIDLIMRDGDLLVFVEVRYRKNAGYGSAVDTVDARKQTRIRNTARHFLYIHERFNACCCRFDVLGIDAGPSGQETFHWIPNAFY